jgi:hypothetical protein
VPWCDGDRDWLLRRDQLAGAWLIGQAQTDGSPIVVQTTTDARGVRNSDGVDGQLARSGASVATYRSSAGSGATYVSLADIKLLATAMRTARGHAIAVTETPALPVQGWAMAVGAVNLSTGQVTEDTRTEEQRSMLKLFVGQLYNGWSHKQVGRRASAYYLPKLAESGMSYSEFVGALLALDPKHLDSNSDIDDMKKALPPIWEVERAALAKTWV